jgi:putative ABC transport system permease protein
MDALYRLLLYTLPADLRREVGADMAQLFRDQCDALAGRPLERAGFVLSAAGDVMAQGVAARLPRRRPFAVAEGPTARSLAMSTVRSDVRHAVRLLWRYPAMSILALATLALGIGANTAIFSVVDAVLLRQLPYAEADQLVMVWEQRRAPENVLQNVVSPADFLDWRARQEPFVGVAALASQSATLTGQGEPRDIRTAAVSWQFFDLFGVVPVHGRRFQPEDEVVGRHRVLLISDGLWRRLFAADPGVVGRKVDLNGNAWEIVGVLPASFRFRDASLDLWAPLPLEVPGQPPSRVSHGFEVFARLKPGVTLDQARVAMDRLGKQIEEEHPQENRGHSAWVTSLREEFVGPVRESLAAIFGAVGLVLLIACANVASLILTRAASRRREMGIRAALGASRLRLITQSLAESVTLSLAGGVIGLGVAFLALEALPLVLPEQVSVVDIGSLTLNVRMLVFALALSVLTGVLFGLLPALAVSRPDVVEAVNQGGRGSAGIRRRVRRALVIGEVTLATLALVSGGLVVRSFMALMSQPVGFSADGRLTTTLVVPGARYATPDQRRVLLEEIEQRLGALPGVTAIGAVNLLPLGGGDSRTGIGIEGRERKEGEPPTRMHPRIVTPGYFSTMGIPVLRGRGFTAADAGSAEPVVVISEASVKRYFGDEDPLGRRVQFGGDNIQRMIVGVVGDVRHWGLGQPANPMIYWPQAQASRNFLTFVLKTSGDPAALAGGVRAAIAQIDPLLPAGELRSLDEVVSRSVRAERALMILMGAFGVVGLLLAAIGIYGVMAQLVSIRTHEIGVRMTLGARPGDILGHFLLDGLWQTAVGIVLGLTAGAYLMTLAQKLLFGVTPWDPPTLAAVCGLLLVASLAACLIPARRAMRVDPVQAIRQP